MATAAVIRFPGSNCEFETAAALEDAGISSIIYNWNETAALSGSKADAYVLPGGFSFQDRVRAGVIAARERIVDVVFEEAVHGKPVLGICNGAQILLESGLVPGWKPGAVQAALASNRVPGRSGYLSRWVFLKKAGESASGCPWLSAMDDNPVPVPIAHAEGRFLFRKEVIDRASEQIGLVYTTAEGEKVQEWPWNPNGSMLSAAGLMNAEGNVLAMMPHPERAIRLWQVPPCLEGEWGRRRRAGTRRDMESVSGPGSVIFRSLAEYLGVKK
ncbi:phosphoribosylformylglycinamidine synthase I [Candidatus Fermentibacteria bacterium]|nr:MAG: phosphoribosylformylglycinamidine synthase I [Candidatus Fermentibacteria bacterium]